VALTVALGPSPWHRKRGTTLKKVITALFLILMMATLTACSLRPHVAKNSQVEEIAQEYINSNVHIVSSKHDIEKGGAGAYVWYQFEDERGINFRVGIDHRYISIVEPIRPFYSSFYSYVTDYKAQVTDYYKEDIIKLLDNGNVKEYDIYKSLNGGINIKFEPDTELSEIAEIIMKINDMLAFDYYYNGESDGYISQDEKSRWHAFSSYDILVEMKNDGSDGNKSLIYTSFDISDNNSTKLTYDKVMMRLCADRYINENSENNSNPVGMFMIDDVLYYDTGEITDTVLESDCSETTKLRSTGVPEHNGESNIGASMPYTKINNELVVFHSDAGHIYRVFEY